MQQIFEINTGQLSQILDAVIAKFGQRRIKVVIEDLAVTPPVDQLEMFRKTEELRLKLKRIKVDSGQNLSDLANEMLGTSL